MTGATTPDRAAMPRSLRRPAAWVAAVAALTVAALGVRYAGMGRSSSTDRVLEGAVEDWIPTKERGFWLIHFFGNPMTVVVLAGLLAALALAVRRPRLAVLAVLGPGLTGLATTALKPLFDRTLDGELAYPSGHTGALTALAIVSAFLLVSLLDVGPVGTTLLISVTVLGAGFAMAVALTALDIHYPTDTVGGFCTAIAVVLAAAFVVDRLADAGRRPQLRS
jgi:undecaprenyl-diphosphatase